jgi:hypothetical protein
MYALDVIQSAYERCNRLSPGETLGADDAAFGFRRLNELVDELSAQNQFLYQDIFTSATVTGVSITLGTGAWAAIPIGTQIVSGEAASFPLAPITMEQYGQIYDNTLSGIPRVYSHDGLATVFLYPVPTSVVVKFQTRTGAAIFADLNTTSYSMPAGWQAALSAALAVRIAPNIIGELPPALVRAEEKLMGAVDKIDPKILDTFSYTSQPKSSGSILRGY